MEESKVLIGTARNGHVRFYVGDTTKLVEDARLVHDCYPTSLAALGRVMSVTACMGLMQKEESQSVTTTINGGGAIGTIMCTADCQGNIKGFVGDNHLYLKYNSNNKLAVGLVVGTNGYLKVLKSMKMKTDYTSQVALQTGEIGDDFAYYLTVSEQIPSVVSVGVLVDTDYSTKAAGILLIELLPDHTEEDIVYLENILKTLEPISSVIERDNDLEKYIRSLFEDAQILETKEVRYHCDCSKERFLVNLLTLPKKDLEELSQDPNIEIKCEFCEKVYRFDKNDIDLVMSYANRKH
ncbi:MAG: Hsp33 family molecular chaperone HslO [Erysipelotrichaceae bacterium]|nr:Hsp33 family molecular chaperone HslO [Erysipelotrichaceae bacterium]